jgi:hypothetical protein
MLQLLVPLLCPLQALEKAGGVVENITWELFKETLLEQAEQVRLAVVLCRNGWAAVPAVCRQGVCDHDSSLAVCL